MRHFAICLSILVVCSFGAFAFAADVEASCDCYCRSTQGARFVAAGIQDDDACRASCDVFDLRFLGCYSQEEQDAIPANNQLCWSQESCEADVAVTALDANGNPSETTPSLWGGQEDFCPEGQGFCYNPPGAVDETTGEAIRPRLGVAIGTLTEVTDITDYIAAVYTFLLSASAIVAVVILMIGGFQYAVAAGNSAAIEQAKSRIGAALLGMVLVFSAYTLARLIDPSLTQFSVLTVPKIRTVVFLEEGSSCEHLISNGITVQPNGGDTCGYSGIVTSVEGATGGDLSIGLEAGDTCLYRNCSGVYESCVQGSGTTPTGYVCASCSDVYDDSVLSTVSGTSRGLTPSSSVCHSMLSDDLEALASARGGKAYCEYYNAGVSEIESSDTCVELIYPAVENQHFIDCDALRQAGEEDFVPLVSCRLYDSVYARSNDAIADILGDPFFGTSFEVDGLNGAGNDWPIASTVCADDPCGFGTRAGGCRFVIWDENNIPLCTAAVISETVLCQVQANFTEADCVDNLYYTKLGVYQSLPASAFVNDPEAVYEGYPVLTDADGNATNRATTDYWFTD